MGRKSWEQAQRWWWGNHFWAGRKAKKVIEVSWATWFNGRRGNVYWLWEMLLLDFCIQLTYLVTGSKGAELVAYVGWLVEPCT